MINNLLSSIICYSPTSPEIKFYLNFLGQEDPCNKAAAHFLRCRKAVLAIFPGKSGLDGLSLSVDKWMTILKKLFQEQASPEFIKKFKDSIDQGLQEDINAVNRKATHFTKAKKYFLTSISSIS